LLFAKQQTKVGKKHYEARVPLPNRYPFVSPILANIYLDKLDKYMKEYTEKFDKGKIRKRCEQSLTLLHKRNRILRKLKEIKDETGKN